MNERELTLLCDVGNTYISIGLSREGSLVLREELLTKDVSRFNSFIRRRLKAKGISFSHIESAVICSVVPAACRILRISLVRLGRFPIYILGKNISVPIKNLYSKPKKVGQDRLVNGYAGVRFYGAPLIVVDFGTAITFDVISEKKEYLGGIILPGLTISLDALSQHTALLPRIKLEKPEGIIGRDTRNSMLSGSTYGFGALCDGLTIKIKQEIGVDAKVIGTGGNINFIKKYCRGIDIVDSDLTLKGLALLKEAFEM